MTDFGVVTIRGFSGSPNVPVAIDDQFGQVSTVVQSDIYGNFKTNVVVPEGQDVISANYPGEDVILYSVQNQNGQDGQPDPQMAGSFIVDVVGNSVAGPQGATGPQGAMGLQGVPGPASSAEGTGAIGVESVTSAQNADGTTTTTFIGGSYFDGKPFYAVADTRDSGGTLTTEVRASNDGGYGQSVYQGDQTVTSAYDDTFLNHSNQGTAFVFDPGHSQDVVKQFVIGGDGHDTLSFLGADFGSSPTAQLGNLLRHTQNSQGGLLIADPTTQDTVTLKGVTKRQLVQNERDVVFR